MAIVTNGEFLQWINERLTPYYPEKKSYLKSLQPYRIHSDHTRNRGGCPLKFFQFPKGLVKAK